MRGNWGVVLGCLLAAVSVGCSAGRILVPEASRKISTSEVRIVRGESTVEVPEVVLSQFEGRLRRGLYGTPDREGPLFREGPDLSLVYSFVRFNHGSQFSCHMWRGMDNPDEGTVTVQVIYSGEDGSESADFNPAGMIKSVYLGGSLNSVVDRCADEIAGYTAANFR
jgi:hypothetical protein